MEFSKRLQEVMRERGMRQADLLELVKPICDRTGIEIQRNALSQYVTGKVVPKQDKARIIAKALGVSTAWLMGIDDNGEAEVLTVDSSRSEPNQVQQMKRAFVDDLFDRISSEGQSKVMAFVVQIAEQEEREKVKRRGTPPQDIL